MKIHVETKSSYNVLIKEGILSSCGEEISKLFSNCKVAIITDSNINLLYTKTAVKSLEENGFTPKVITFSAGEAFKTMETLSNILEELAENKITRSDIILALGGGVTGDIAGFAASVYLRGISFVQIPTSLLAMIDSSVGGKTAVDLKAGKNMAGAFWQPSLVLCDPNLLKTLSADYWLDGIGEAIKYAFGFDNSIFPLLTPSLRTDKTAISQLIYKCIAIKAAVVTADETDNGQRQKLNLGHTIGHAIELCSNFSISHGKAVAMGTLIMAKAAVKMDMLQPSAVVFLQKILEQNSLLLPCPYSPKLLANAALGDKKRRGDKISIILPTAVGSCVIKPIPVTQLEYIFATGLKQSPLIAEPVFSQAI